MGLNPSKISKHNRAEFEFNYKPRLNSGSVSKKHSIPTDIIHEIASFMTLKEIIHSFSCLSRGLRGRFFLNPTSPHWKIINLSDEIMFGDLQMEKIVQNGVLIHSEMIILRRTNVTSYSLRKITKFLKKNPDNNLSLLDVRGCCKVSRSSSKLLQRSKPSIQIRMETRSDHFECTSETIEMSNNIFSNSNYFNRLTQESDNNIIYYGFDVAKCACDYCSAFNVKMKLLMAIYGPYYLDVFVGNFKYDFFEKASSSAKIDCFTPTFGTSKSFIPTGNSLNYILRKLWKYRLVKSANLELIYRKYTHNPLFIGEEEMNSLECFCDRYGPIIVLRNDHIVVIATICNLGVVFTSFDKLTSLGNAIKASRFLSCNAHYDLVDIA